MTETPHHASAGRDESGDSAVPAVSHAPNAPRATAGAGATGGEPGRCAQCGVRVRLRDAVLSPKMPFFLRCRNCRAELRLANLREHALSVVWSLCAAVIVVALGTAFGAFGALGPRAQPILFGLPAGLAWAFFMVYYPVRFGRFVRTSEAPGGDTRYWVTGVGVSAAGILVFGAATFGMVYGARRFVPEPALPSLERVERGAPIEGDLMLRPVGGGDSVSLESLRGRPVFLNFFATWCVPCVDELPGITRLFEAVGERVVFVVASVETPQTIGELAAGEGIDLPFYTYAGLLPGPLRHEILPTTYVLDARGRIVYSRSGAARWDTAEARAFLRALASEG